MKYKQYLADYEVETGEKASDFLKQFVEALDAAAVIFEGKGREHAAAGHEPLTLEDLMSWAERNARAELAVITGNFMYNSYLEGYVTGRGMV